MGSHEVLDRLMKRYGDQRYEHSAILNHRGVIIAFAMNEKRQIFYTVLNPEEVKEKLDSEGWSVDPVLLTFPSEIEQVGFGLIKPTKLPVVKKGTRIEASHSILKLDEIDPFLSTTARLTASAPFKVFSDTKYVFVFRQAISSDHSDTLFTLQSGASSALGNQREEDYVHDADGNKVPIVNSTLLCDRFVLAKSVLRPSREVRFQRSRHRTVPASRNDVLGVTDMNGLPFFMPTQELTFVENLSNGMFDVAQLPTAISGLKRWHIFSYNSATECIDSFNVEVSEGGLFDVAGTQLFTSPDPEYQGAVLERQPGQCPFTKKDLVPVYEKDRHEETALRIKGSGQYAKANISTWQSSKFAIEMWVNVSTNVSSNHIAFCSQLTKTNNCVTIQVTQGEWIFSHDNAGIVIAEAENGWHHIAVSHDGTSTSVYYDGEETRKVQQQISGVFSSYVLGKGSAASGTFSGAIDEVCIWNRDLSQGEINLRRKRRLVGNENGLRAYWRFDDGFGMSAQDSSMYSSHLTLEGGADWIASTCPVFENPSLHRNSFKLESTVISGGISTQLFFQNEDERSGYDEVAKPMKKQARLLVAFGSTPSNKESSSHIAVLDVAVTREGRIARLAPVITLPNLSKPVLSDDLGLVKQLEADYRLLSENVLTCEGELVLQQAVVASYGDPYFTQSLALSTYNNALKDLEDARKDPVNIYHRLKCLQPGQSSQYVGVNSRGLLEVGYRKESGGVFSLRKRTQWYSKRTYHVLYYLLGDELCEIQEDWSYLDGADGRVDTFYRYRRRRGGSSSGGEDEWEFDVEAKGDSGNVGIKPRGNEFAIATGTEVLTTIDGMRQGNPSAVSIELEKTDTLVGSSHLQQNVDNAEAALAAANTVVAEYEKELEKLRQKEAELADLKSQRDAKLAESSALVAGSEHGLQVEMEELYKDAAGLAVSGGVLQFAEGNVPRLSNFGSGRVTLFFRGDAGHLMAAYYDTSVSRTKFSLRSGEGEVEFVAKSAGSPGQAPGLTVANGPTPTTCNLELRLGKEQETWSNLPRKVKRIAELVNGTVQRDDDDTVTVTTQPASLGSNHASPLVAVTTGTKDISVSNGSATVVPGQGCRWVADAPGRAFYYTTSRGVPFTPSAEDTAPGDRFTVEAWVNPAEKADTISRLVHHLSDSCAYTLALQKEGLSQSGKQMFGVIAAVSSGAGSNHDVSCFVQTADDLEEDKWTHLALSFEKAYGIAFHSSDYVDCGTDSRLNITEDLTVEVFLRLNNQGQGHGLLGKGRFGDTGKGVPYQLRVDASGYVQFLFEKNGQHVQYKSSKALQAGAFHRIAVTRKAGNKERRTEDPSEVSYTDADGNLQKVSVNAVSAVSFEQFYDINFFIDNEDAGSGKYTEAAPLGHDGSFDIGSCFTSASQRIYTNGNIAEVRIWKTARAASEVCAKLTGSEPGLVSWWTFEEGKGNTTKDPVTGSQGRLRGAQWTQSPDADATVLKVYMNGSPQSVSDLPANHAIISGDWGNQGMSLAGFKSGGNESNKLMGLLEEVRVWKTVRTEEQIMDNLFTRLKGEKQDLVAYYTFDFFSTGNDSSTLYDHSLRGNNIQLPAEGLKRPISMLSTAPISYETAAVRCALSGVETDFNDTADSAPAVCEYSELQRSLTGGLAGNVKRCYSYTKNGEWTLITGYKAGSLVSEWMGQVQFDPQVMGFVEGAPPVPGENLAKSAGTESSNGSSIDIVESKSVSYSIGATKEGSTDMAFAAGATIQAGSDDLLILAPLGFGAAKQVTDIDIEAGLNGNFNVSEGWFQEETQGKGINQSRTLSVSTSGAFESDEAGHQGNPSLGARLLPENTGFALVQSSTADVYALRMAHNNALVTVRMVPNHDIPKDWNIISFPINPMYTKQGTLDGKIGFDDRGSVIVDSSYPSAGIRGEYSYYKPTEAYATERRIRLQQQKDLAYYEDFKTNYGSAMGKVAGASAGAAAALLIPGVGPAIAAGAIAYGLATIGKTFEDSKISSLFAKRDLVNTYVWTADGGFFAESTETSNVRTEVSGGNFGFSGGVGGTFGLDLEIFSIGVNLAFEASFGGGMSVTKTRSKESEDTFSLDVSVDIPRDLQKYEPGDDGESWNPVYDNNGEAVRAPGKVDAYRFKTFYLDCSSANFDDLFRKVIDPIWLAESKHPNAAAMRQARQSDKKPPCWRVFHRVTFVSRVLPEFQDPTAAPLESAMKAQNINSNWQLIQILEPWVRDKTTSYALFSTAVREALSKQLPELIPQEQEIIRYLMLYYGVA